MSAATGLGLVDIAILEACEASTDGHPLVLTRTVLGLLHDRTGIGPRVATEPLYDLARPWVAHLPLLTVHGNYGSQDDPPANPKYTECGMTPLGTAALAAERGEMGMLPIGLINGTTSVGGTQPPFDPTRAIAAIRQAATTSASDADLVATIGRPAFPTGCEVDGDLAGLAAGHAAQLTLTARLDSVRGSSRYDHIEIRNLPPDSGNEEIAERIADNSRRHVHQERWPVHDIEHRVVSRGGEDYLAVILDLETDPEPVMALLRSIWAIRRTVSAQLPAPLAQLIRAAAADTDGLETRLDILATGIRSATE